MPCGHPNLRPYTVGIPCIYALWAPHPQPPFHALWAFPTCAQWAFAPRAHAPWAPQPAPTCTVGITNTCIYTVGAHMPCGYSQPVIMPSGHPHPFLRPVGIPNTCIYPVGAHMPCGYSLPVIMPSGSGYHHHPLFMPCGHSQHVHMPCGHPNLPLYAPWAFPTCAYGLQAPQPAPICPVSIPTMRTCPVGIPTCEHMPCGYSQSVLLGSHLTAVPFDTRAGGGSHPASSAAWSGVRYCIINRIEGRQNRRWSPLRVNPLPRPPTWLVRPAPCQPLHSCTLYITSVLRHSKSPSHSPASPILNQGGSRLTQEIPYTNWLLLCILGSFAMVWG